MNHKQSIAEKFYLKHEHLANIYAKQIFNYERYGYQYQDLVQELKIKIYTSVLSYAKKWQEYKETGRYKPIPLEFYIKTALVNRTKDFIKQFNKEAVENVDKLPIENFDHGYFNDAECRMDLSSLVCSVNGIDFFYKMVGNERRCFALYLKGFPVKKLISLFPKIDVEDLIDQQVTYLKYRKDELLNNNYTYFSSVVYEESN